jgi:hypothetical protein
MPKAKHLKKEECLAAVAKTKSNRAAARYLNCSYTHWKKWAKFYKDETFEVSYRPKIYSSSESFLNVFDIDAHLDYEVWFYPEDYR